MAGSRNVINRLFHDTVSTPFFPGQRVSMILRPPCLLFAAFACLSQAADADHALTQTTISVHAGFGLIYVKKSE